METPAPAEVKTTPPAAVPAPPSQASEAAPAAPVTPAAAPERAAGTFPSVTSDKVSDIDALLEGGFDLNPVGLDPKLELARQKAGLPADVAAARAAAAPVEAAPAAPAVPVTPEVPASREPTAEEARVLPKYIPTEQFDDQTARAMVLLRALNEGKKPTDQGYVPLKDCIARIEAADAPPVPPASAANAAVVADRLTQVTTQVTEIETKLSEVDGRIAEYKANPELYGEELQEANDERSELRIQLGVMKGRQEDLQEASRNAALEQTRTDRHASIVAAETRYPSLADKKGDLRAIANQITRELKADAHPEHGLLALPTAATIVADRAAARLATARAEQHGTSFAEELAKLLAKPVRAPAPAAPVVPPAPVPEPRKILPSPGASGTTPVVPRSVDQKVQEVLADNDPEAWKKAESMLDAGNDPYLIR